MITIQKCYTYLEVKIYVISILYLDTIFKYTAHLQGLILKGVSVVFFKLKYTRKQCLGFTLRRFIYQNYIDLKASLSLIWLPRSNEVNNFITV